MFTQYKFSASQISLASVQAAQALAVAMPGENPAAFAAATISIRLRDDPAAYLQFGPYWWAVKAALVQLGTDLGPTDDANTRVQYGASLPVYGALVAGEQFRVHYLRTWLAGTAVFWLDEQGLESYSLFDPDMEVRRLGGGLAVAAGLLAAPASP